jgi:hypothetical protein
MTTGERMIASSLEEGTTIELGPHLPMAAYHAMERWQPERIGAMALYCSDGRWGEAFDEFCHRHLQIPRYDRLAVPGGPAWIAAYGKDPAQGRTTRTYMDFLVRAHELERVVLITHYGCAWYGHLLNHTPDECLAPQSIDIRTAAAVLRDWYPDLRVEGYLAMRKQAVVSFHQLDTGS